MGIRIAIVGTGAFSQCFIPLFKVHPGVDEIILCDLDSAKLDEACKQFDISSKSPSLDDVCSRDIDAVTIFTQNDRHGPQALQALRAGKHVYSAVPSAITMDEIRSLVTAVEETGLTYMIGETSYYYPCTIYCRDRFRKGDFGKAVYAEAEYYHDFDHGIYDVLRWRFGDQWRELGGAPPMYYPTHSVSMVVSVTGARMTSVSCMGFVDNGEDGLYDPDINIYHNPFSNQCALFRMSDGSISRINEFRRVGHPGTVGMSLYGTLGSYEEQTGSQAWITKQQGVTEDLRELLECRELPVESRTGAMQSVTAAGTHMTASAIHPIDRLPLKFAGKPNGHLGSHQFLVDDFVRACNTGRMPPNNIWMAARYLIPGLIAHESSMKEGQLLDVPDLGNPPGEFCEEAFYD